VTTASNLVVNLIVNVLQTPVAPRTTTLVPGIAADSIKLAVRKQKKGDVAPQRCCFIGDNPSHAVVLRVTGTVRSAPRIRELGPLR
jgi:hypothetical protein